VNIDAPLLVQDAQVPFPYMLTKSSHEMPLHFTTPPSLHPPSLPPPPKQWQKTEDKDAQRQPFSHLLPHPITSNSTPKERPIVLQRKRRPIVRKLVIAPKPAPRQLVILGAPPGTPKRQLQLVHVLGIDALGLNVQVAFGLSLGINIGADVLAGTSPGPRKTPPPPKGGIHNGDGRKGGGVTGMRILPGEVVDDVGGLGGGEEAKGGAVAEEAQVAVVGDDVDGGVPRDLGGRRGAGADVVDGADVAAVEADARAGAEHAEPGGGVGFVEDGEGCWVGGWCG